MLRRSLQHICSALEIEAALMNVGLPTTVSPLWAKLIGFFFFFWLAELVMLILFYESELFFQSRPEELTLDDFVKLHNEIAKV